MTRIAPTPPAPMAPLVVAPGSASTVIGSLAAPTVDSFQSPAPREYLLRGSLLANALSRTPLRPAQLIRHPGLDALYPQEGQDGVPFYRTDAGKRVLIDGTVREWTGPTRKVLSPILVHRPDGSLTPHEIGEIAWMDERAALTALDTAVKAYDSGKGVWPTMTLAERCEALTKFITRLKTRRENLVQLLVWEVGKKRKDAEIEFDRTVKYMEMSIAKAMEMNAQGNVIEASGDDIRKLFPTALGIVLCMGPFNYPFNEAFGTSAFPALLMGNVVLYKPAKKGQLILSEILDIFQETLPPGTISGVSGDGETVITPLMKSGQLAGFHFIGSESVAKRILSNAPNSDKMRVVLGLGAKNFAVVLPGADLDATAEIIVKGGFDNNGQRCTGYKGVIAHESIAELLAQKIAKRVSTMRIGMPYDPLAAQTPLPEDGKVNFLRGFAEDALLHGAQFMNDAGGAFNDTMFVPAVLYLVTPEMRIATEEQFGAIIPVMSYRGFDEAERFLEGLPFRQQASVFGDTASPEVSRAVAKLLALNQRVNINAAPKRGPDIWLFGARNEVLLSADEALRVFSVPTQVVLSNTPANHAALSSMKYEDLMHAGRRG